MADGKPFSTWLSGDLLKRAEARAEALQDGNESKYVRSLIERDVRTDPATLLFELAQAYHPAVEEKVKLYFVAKPLLTDVALNQKLVIARFLDALIHAVEENSAFDPTKPFELTDAKKANEYYDIGDERMEQIAHRVMELQAEYSGGSAKPSGGREAAKDAVKAAKLGASSKKSKAS